MGDYSEVGFSVLNKFPGAASALPDSDSVNNFLLKGSNKEAQKKIAGQLGSNVESVARDINEELQKQELMEAMRKIASMPEGNILSVEVALQNLGVSIEELAKLMGEQPTNAKLALQGTPGNQQTTLQDASEIEKLVARFANFGTAASVLRDILHDATKTMEEALYTLGMMLVQINNLYAQLNQIARDKTKASAVQSCKASVDAAAASIFKEIAITGGQVFSTTKHIHKTEKMNKDILKYKQGAVSAEIHGKASKFDTNGTGSNNELFGSTVAKDLNIKAQNLTDRVSKASMQHDKNAAISAAAKTGTDSAIRIRQAEEEKESKLTQNEAKDAEFQKDVAQKTIENYNAAMRKNLQALMDFIQQVRSSQQNLLSK